jgi:hypothetical protein
MSIVLAGCGLIAAALLAYLMVVLFRGEGR